MAWQQTQSECAGCGIYQSQAPWQSKDCLQSWRNRGDAQRVCAEPGWYKKTNMFQSHVFNHVSPCWNMVLTLTHIQTYTHRPLFSHTFRYWKVTNLCPEQTSIYVHTTVCMHMLYMHVHAHICPYTRVVHFFLQRCFYVSRYICAVLCSLFLYSCRYATCSRMCKLQTMLATCACADAWEYANLHTHVYTSMYIKVRARTHTYLHIHVHQQHIRVELCVACVCTNANKFPISYT